MTQKIGPREAALRAQREATFEGRRIKPPAPKSIVLPSPKPKTKGKGKRK